jgi:hypothetical protein
VYTNGLKRGEKKIYDFEGFGVMTYLAISITFLRNTRKPGNASVSSTCLPFAILVGGLPIARLTE